MALKRRRWIAYFSISASGPEYSSDLAAAFRTARPRIAADLRFTTADVDYLERHFKDPHYDSGQEELHVRLRNPTREKVNAAFDQIEEWFDRSSEHTAWDGGGLDFCFAGHGREGDGALVLQDDVLTSSDYLARLSSMAKKVSQDGRIRVSAILDSCHSAAFAIELLESCFNRHNDSLIPWNVIASCMHDEVAWEEPSLGHGVFTYCFSVRAAQLGSMAATAIQPDNQQGPSLSIASGALGCSLLTAGAQNPVDYFNGAGHIRIGGSDIRIVGDDGVCLSQPEIRNQLEAVRDRFSHLASNARADLRMDGRMSDTQVRTHIAALRDQLRAKVAQPGDFAPMG